MTKKPLYKQNIIACVWDFDKTLIPGYMQTPLFDAFGIDEKHFWKEVNALPEIYAEKGTKVSADTIYLNHLLSYVKNGLLEGLTNAKLRELGRSLKFCPGLPELFPRLQALTKETAAYRKHNIELEHYIISTGLAEMIKGSTIAPHVTDIFGCEFIEAPMPPNFSKQEELTIALDFEISQIGTIVDNTIKTRYIFEINKGGNKNPSIDVNAYIAKSDRRIPIDRMLYIADGPSDIPCFSVVKNNGGKTFAVFQPGNDAEFEQNDALLHAGRIHSYGPADYTEDSTTTKWLSMHLRRICDRVVSECESTVSSSIQVPPIHLHKKEDEAKSKPVSPNASLDLFKEAPKEK